MSRISQDLAGQIAHKLTQKSRDAVAALRKEYENAVRDAYMNQIPEEVAVTFVMHPDWFSTNNHVKLDGFGFRYEWVSFEGSVICNRGQECFLTLDRELAAEMNQYKMAYEKAKGECEKLKKETERALVNLRTYKNIADNMPAAKPFLPPPVTLALVVNVEKINEKLALQPEVKQKEETAQVL